MFEAFSAASAAYLDVCPRASSRNMFGNLSLVLKGLSKLIPLYYHFFRNKTAPLSFRLYCFHDFTRPSHTRASGINKGERNSTPPSIYSGLCSPVQSNKPIFLLILQLPVRSATLFSRRLRSKSGLKQRIPQKRRREFPRSRRFSQYS